MSRALSVTVKTALAVVVAVLSTCSQSYAYEMTLGGLRLGRSAMTVLQKYGDPTRISVGMVAIDAAIGGPQQTEQQQQPAYDPYGLGGASSAGMPSMTMPQGSLAPYSPFAGDYSPPAGGMLPALPGLGGPPMTMPGAPTPEGGEQRATITQQEVTWTYDLSGGVTLEVIIAEGGIITQITVAGAARWAASRTSKGIQLNSTYKDVLYKYGYPEAHMQAGRFLRVSYVDKDRCLFTLLNKKVVGITIAFNE